MFNKARQWMFVLALAGCAHQMAPAAVKGFLLKERFTEDGRTNVSVFTKGPATFRLKMMSGLSSGQAGRIQDQSVEIMHSLYDRAANAYPGMVSQEIVCNDAYVPREGVLEAGGEKIPYFIAYLSSRMTYGACVEDLTVYRGVLAWTYCADLKEFRQAELIYPKEAFQEQQALDFIREGICAEW